MLINYAGFLWILEIWFVTGAFILLIIVVHISYLMK
jgi:hypothetical protein